MSDPGSSALVALVTHARLVPASERESFALRLRHELSDRSLVLETCHRVEGYVVCPDERGRSALGLLLPVGGRALTGEDAVRHAIAVAAGRDSVVTGEDQVLHQLRESVDAARSAGRLDPILERLFAVALHAGRSRSRSWRQAPPRSLADVALASIQARTASLRGREILVVGAGRMGRLAAQAAVAAGASTSIANRSADRAHALAARTGARVEPFDPGNRVSAFAGVVVALGGPWPIGGDTIDALRASATVVVDLSVPGALPAVATRALGRRFVSADNLARAEDEPGLHDGAIARYEALVDRTTADFLDWLKGRSGRTAADALIKRADRDRETELAALWRKFPDLQPEARDAIEGMTRHLARRLLREPLERLGRDADGSDERAVRDIFAL